MSCSQVSPFLSNCLRTESSSFDLAGNLFSRASACCHCWPLTSVSMSTNAGAVAGAKLAPSGTDPDEPLELLPPPQAASTIADAPIRTRSAIRTQGRARLRTRITAESTGSDLHTKRALYATAARH